MCGGGGGFNPVSIVTAPIKTVTSSVAAAVSDIGKGNIGGAASSLGNAVNPVALTQSVATGQSTSNSGDTLHALQGDVGKAVQTASIYTGLSPSQIQQAGLAYATGGLSSLPDLATDFGTSLLNGSSTAPAKALPTTRAAGAGPVGAGASVDSTSTILVAGALAVGVYLYARR